MTIPRLDSLDKNYLRNGAFDLFQYGLDILTVAGVPAYYAPDRWFINTANQQFTLKRSTDVPPNSKSRFSLEYNTVSAIGGTDRVMATTQKIESIFSKELSGKPISLRFDYRSFSANQVQIVMSVPDVEDIFSVATIIYNQTFSINNDDAWDDFKLENIVLPDVSNGLHIEILYKNTVLLVGNNGHKIADIKLSVGVKAQEFSLAGRDVAEEIRQCQRYFEKSDDLDTLPLSGLGNNGGSIYISNSSGRAGSASIKYKVSKRTTPVITAIRSLTFNLNTFYEGQHSHAVSFDGGAGNGSLDYHWTADAEL